MLSSNEEEGSNSASIRSADAEIVDVIDLMETIEPRIDNLSMKCFSIITNNENHVEHPSSAAVLADTDTVEPRSDNPYLICLSSQSDTKPRDSIVKLTSNPRYQSYRRTAGLSEKELAEIGYSNHRGKWRGFPYDSWSCCKSNELQCPVLAISSPSEPRAQVLSIAKATLHSRTIDGDPDQPERPYLKFLKKSTKSTVTHQVSREIRSRSTEPVNRSRNYDTGPKQPSVRKFVIKIDPRLSKDSCVYDLSNEDGNSSCSIVSNIVNQVSVVVRHDGSEEEEHLPTNDRLQSSKQSNSLKSSNTSSYRKAQTTQSKPVHCNTTDLPSGRSHQKAKKTRGSPRLETPIDPTILQSIGDKRLRATLANEYLDANTVATSKASEIIPTIEDLDIRNTTRDELPLPVIDTVDDNVDSVLKVNSAVEEKTTQTAWPAFSHSEPAKLIESIKRKLSKDMTSRSTPVVSNRKSTSASPSSRYYFSPAVTNSVRASTTVGVDVTKRFGSDHFHGSTSPAWVPASKSADLSSASSSRSFNHSDSLTTTRTIDRAIVKPPRTGTTTRLSFPKPAFSSYSYHVDVPIEDRYMNTLTSRSHPIPLTDEPARVIPDCVPADKQEPSITLPTKIEDSNTFVIDRHRDWLIQILRAKELYEERGYYKKYYQCASVISHYTLLHHPQLKLFSLFIGFLS